MSDGNPERFLREMRDALQAFTQADPYFSDIEIVSEKLKDIEGRIEQTIGTIGGICVLLVTPVAGGMMQNVKGANFKDLRFVARVLENVNTNDTGKEALDVAIALANLWNQEKPDTFPTALVPSDDAITMGNDPVYRSYDVAFATEGGVKISIPRLAPVSINAPDLSAITLAHGTPGAAIFYTLDGTAPIPRNEAAQLALAPFSATAGQKLRARAWLAGYTASAELTQTL